METLTPELVQKIIEAQVRLRELGGHNTIIDPKSEAEVTGLKRFLGDVFVKHGEEFIGNWIIIQQEYSPLIKVLELIGNRLIIRHKTIRQPPPPTVAAQQPTEAPQ